MHIPPFFIRCSLATLIGSIIATNLNAQSIGLNFVRGSTGASSLSAGDIAGVVPAGNWNNAPQANANNHSDFALTDDSGAATSATAAWSSGGASWSVTTSGPGGAADKLMMTGYLDQGGNGAGQIHTITINNIPYATYDVYLYHSSSGGANRTARYNANGDDLFTRNLDPANTFNGFANAQYSSIARAANFGNPAGNYVRWQGLSGTLSIEGQGLGDEDGGAGGNTRRAPIQGIQIVATSVTPGLPEIKSSAVSAITSNSATANGNLIDNGDGADSATVTFFWGTSDGGSVPDSWDSSEAGGAHSSPGFVSASLTGLSPNTNYFYRAFVSNSAGDNWAPSSETFTTPAALATVQNIAASGILGTSATVGGTVTSTGGEDPVLVIHYGDNDAGTGAWDSQLNLGTQAGSASGSLTGLTPGTSYFFRAAVTNSGGMAWAPSSESFGTTPVTAPSVINTAATGVNGTFATLNGEITDAGGDVPSVTIYYGTSDGGSVPGNWQSSNSAGNQSGAFSRLVTNLQPTTTYFFRAFAQNLAGGTWSSPSLNFTTPVYIPPSVVINEIHSDESDKTVRAEFIELFNPSNDPVDLASYYFSDGIDFTFPENSILSAGGYLVVAEDPATMLSKFGFSGAYGPFANGTSLKNSGEQITLRNPDGADIDSVNYGIGFPWPTVGGEIGSPLASPSMELINPLLDNDLGGSWRASGFPVATSSEGGGPVTLLNPAQPGWRYRKGTSYPGQDGSGKAWWDNGYDDSADGEWLDGTAVIGYGDGDDTTLLTDMQGNYLSIFLRKEFTIAEGGVPNSIDLGCYHDDGAIVYLNGVEVERFSVDNGAIPFPPPENFANNHEASWSNSTIGGVASYLVEGTNVIAIQCLNDRFGSSDLSIDAQITTIPNGGGGSNAPTPGTANQSFAANAPPQIRQVSHLPHEPASGQDVLVTAKITDPDGVESVSLQYQLVEPGDYFCRYLKFNNNGTSNEDPRYSDPSNWTTLTMTDDGNGGDALALDSVFSVTLPAALQTNRRLIRYRITSADLVGTAITVPYQDDPQPNFAYFVYDGTPDWSGAIRGGDTPVNYPGSLMSSIPTYFLLSTNTWVDDSQFGGYSGSEYLWPGTMVYDGKVYDHIQYRPRGGVHRYQYGKNFWKFDFGRGRRFQARDRYGEEYETQWDKLNFSSIVQQVNFNHRGEQGLFESVGFKLFDLCEVEACETHYVQFYVIDENSPTGANQYEGDYYGLFLAIEQMDGRYLDQHDLPDGNLYKIEGHNGDSNNQGPTQVSDGSDVSAFINGYRGNSPSAQWWEDNLDIDKYLSYRTIVEGIHHYDIAGGKNYYYYHNPVTEKFEVHPWDLDLTWADNMFGSGNHDFKTKVAQNPAFNTRYQNRVREIKDLLYNDDEGHRLIDEMTRDVWTPGFPSLVSADRRLWDNNPRLNHKDRYYDVASDRDFSGMIQVLKNYVVSRGNWMTSNLLTQENSVPATPTITYSGSTGFASNDLVFTSTPYTSGTPFAAMEWRISEVYNPTVSNYVAGEPYIYEIEKATGSGELTSFTSSYLFPALSARPGQTYRARVRHKDSVGRYSHWSAPVEFLVSEPDVSQLVSALRVSELHYHPAPASADEQANGWEDSDFEFIEIKNISEAMVDLTNLRFTKGVDFDFSPGTLIGPGAYQLVIKNQAAFESRYGAGLPIAGEWALDYKLSNGGENLKLSLGAGTAVIEFVYDDEPPWPTAPDGQGPSLTLICPDESMPADHADPFAWWASRLYGGTPGWEDQIDFMSWAVDKGLGAEASLFDDPDGDGMNNLLEYALASNPIVASNEDLPLGGRQDVEVGGNIESYLTLSFQRQVGTKDLSYHVEVSNDLESWQADVAVLLSSTNHNDGTATEVWRSPLPVSSRALPFMRLKVKN